MSYTPKHDESGSAAPAANTASDQKKKQKIIAVAVVAVLAVVIIVMLALILRGGGSRQSSPLYPDGVLPTSGVRHDVVVLPNGGKNAMEVNGLWRLDQITLYEFDGYGRGIMHTAVDDYSFVYSAENGLLEIDFDTDDGRDTEYYYTLEGDSMTLTRGEVTYNFTKEY